MWYIGIDISKQTLDVALLIDLERLKKRSKKLSNTVEGFAELIGWCRQHSGAEPAELHAVMEATGPYHEAVAEALYEAGFRVSVINPKRLKDFASGQGIKAKNDALDALTIARFGAMNKPSAWQPPPTEIRHLTALLRRIDAVETDLQRERNRREKIQQSPTPTPAVIDSIERGIQHLEDEHQRLQQQVDDHIDRHPQLKKDRQHLRSIPGVGRVLSAQMVMLLQSGQRFDSAAQFASYLGVIPTEHTSGTSVRQPPHLSKIGPASIRAKLYMAALVATRHNPDLSTLSWTLFYRLFESSIAVRARHSVSSATAFSRPSPAGAWRP